MSSTPNNNENIDIDFQGTSLPAVLLGNDLKVRRFSPQAEKTLNLVSSDIDKHITEIHLSIMAPDLDKLVLGVIHTGHVYEREIQDKAGRWYSMRIRPFKMNNHIDGSVIVLVDIDDIKKKSDEFKEERDYSTAIIDTLREPFLVLKKDLTVESANRAYYHTFECSPEETLGKPIDQTCCNSPELRSALDEIVARHTSVRNFELKHIFPRIGLKILLINARKVRPDNQTEFIFLGIEDVSERREIEHRHQGAIAALEQFASAAAHDLRAPLTIIMMIGEQLQKKIQGAEKIGLDKMLKAAQRMSLLMEELLNFSRLSTDVELLEPVDLNEVVRMVLADLEASIKEWKADIKFDELPIVKANFTLMYQLFQNLIANAIKFRKKDVALNVKIFGIKISQGFSQITIKDNGIGFDQKLALEIFKPFRRLHGHSEYAGSGLGLALCEKIVRRYGGIIQAKSVPGEGSEFSIKLPAMG